MERDAIRGDSTNKHNRRKLRIGKTPIAQCPKQSGSPFFFKSAAPSIGRRGS